MEAKGTKRSSLEPESPLEFVTLVEEDWGYSSTSSLMVLRLPLRYSQPSLVGYSLPEGDSKNGTLGPTDFSFPAGTFFLLESTMAQV